MKKKYVYNPADLEAALPMIQGGIAVKRQRESTVSQGSPFSFDSVANFQSSAGPPVLKDEDQISVR